MFKRVLAVVLAALMLMAMATVAVSAAESTEATTGESMKIRFNTAGWSNFKTVYCYVWVAGGDNFFAWEGGDTVCTPFAGTIYEYDLANLAKSTTVPGGYKSGEDYCVIFHTDTKSQTYDLTLGDACINDIAYITGNKIENPVDSNKEGFEAKWTNSGASYGPHLEITSIGNIVGEKLCPGETYEQKIADWIVGYPKTSAHCEPSDVVAEAMKKFGVTETSTIISLLDAKSASDWGIGNRDEAVAYVEAGYKKAYPAGSTAGSTAPGTTAKPGTTKPGTTKPLETDPKTGETIPVQITTDPKTGETVAVQITTDPQTGETVAIPVETDPATGTVVGGGSTGGSSSYTANSSGTGADGENDTILFVLAGVMLLVAGAFVVTRKRREE